MLPITGDIEAIAWSLILGTDDGLKIVGADELADVYYMDQSGIQKGSPVAIKSAWVDPPTKLPDPAVLPTSIGYGVAWDPTGQYLAVAHFNSPYLTVYRREGDSLTKLPNPAVLPTGTGYGVAWDPTGQYLAVAHSTSPYLTVYRHELVAYATGNTLATLLSYITTGVIGVGIAAETGGFKEQRKVLRIWRNE